MSKITTSLADIQEAVDQFSKLWNSLASEWDDNSQRYFEEEFVGPALSTTRNLLEQTQQLSYLIYKARNSVD